MVSTRAFSFLRKALVIVSLTGALVISSSAYTQKKLSDRGGWEEVFPGGETLCARGEPFSFFVNKGTSDKVVVDFIGGGACWNAHTCSKEGATFVDSVDMIREMYEKGLDGIYNHEDANNPLKDWTHVVIPYCTGDIHWGEHDKVYTKEDGESFTIHHRGAINARAVYEWVKKEILQPKKFLVTGCSAGSYGSIYWAPYFRKLYPGAVMSQMGDSGAGVITPDFLQQSFAIWRAERNAPKWIEGLDPAKVNWYKMSLNDVYHRIGLHYPGMKLGQFNYSHDEGQMFFHEIMGGEPEDWSELMMGRMTDLSQKLDNFDYYLAQGDDHCILPYSRFHTEKTGKDGKLFKEWLMSHTDHSNLSPFISR